jgi:hypothetical protein
MSFTGRYVVTSRGESTEFDADQENHAEIEFDLLRQAKCNRPVQLIDTETGKILKKAA